MAQTFRGRAESQQKFSRPEFIALMYKTDELVSAATAKRSWKWDMHLDKPTSTLTGASLDDLESEINEAQWTHLNWGSATCHGHRDESDPDYSLYVHADVGYPSDDHTRVSIAGANQTEVEGITAQLREFGNDLRQQATVISELTTAGRPALPRTANRAGGETAPVETPSPIGAKRFTKRAEWKKRFSRSASVALARKVEELMAAEMPRNSLSYTVHLKKPESTLTGGTLDQLESALDDAAWSHLSWADVNYHGRQEQHTDITLSAWLRLHYPTASRSFISVDGLHRTAVEGIAAQLQEFGDELLQASRATHSAALRARLGGWLNSPWVVTIVGGVIVGVIVAIIVAIVLG
jgi:hypothetical protein